MIEDIPEELSKAMNEIAYSLNNIFKPMGFVLLVFDLNTTTGRMNYISNSRREDVLIAMKEYIAVQEGRRIESNESH